MQKPERGEALACAGMWGKTAAEKKQEAMPTILFFFNYGSET